jgi:carbonic anhydrase/acetyltransferase-like protein (isoleucine patch superfamily)
LGVPGRVAREISDEDILMIEHAAKHYVETGLQYRAAEISSS